MPDTTAPEQDALLAAISALTPQIQQLILLMSEAQSAPEGAAARIKELIEALTRIGTALAITSDQLGDLLTDRLPALEDRMTRFEATQVEQVQAIRAMDRTLGTIRDWLGGTA